MFLVCPPLNCSSCICVTGPGGGLISFFLFLDFNLALWVVSDFSVNKFGLATVFLWVFFGISDFLLD